jgi:hypothetical protein
MTIGTADDIRGSEFLPLAIPSCEQSGPPLARRPCPVSLQLSYPDARVGHDDCMTVNMTMSLPDDVAAFVKAKGNASAYTARILRRQMLSEEMEKSARLRNEAGIVATAAEPAESEDATLERWARVAGR